MPWVRGCLYTFPPLRPKVVYRSYHIPTSILKVNYELDFLLHAESKICDICMAIYVWVTCWLSLQGVFKFNVIVELLWMLLSINPLEVADFFASNTVEGARKGKKYMYECLYECKTALIFLITLASTIDLHINRRFPRAAPDR